LLLGEKNMMKQHFSSILFSIIAIVLGYMIGGFHGAWVVAILGVLEISLSFDNAVVNASILKNWSALWRHRFLTWGMPVAVFGMRLVFPLLIVAIIAQINPINALILALKNPQQYAHILSQAHNQIAAYGGSFLFMIFLKYFLNAEKDVHWIQPVEAPLTKLGKLEAIQCALVLVFVVGASHLLEASHQLSFVVAGICGIVTYILADAFGSFVGGEEESEEKTQGPSRIIKEGLMGLLYLELLDASFSRFEQKPSRFIERMNANLKAKSAVADDG
jgi:hypothetical protein